VVYVTACDLDKSYTFDSIECKGHSFTSRACDMRHYGLLDAVDKASEAGKSHQQQLFTPGRLAVWGAPRKQAL